MIRTYGVNGVVPWPVTGVDNGSHQRLVIVAAPSKAAAVRAITAAGIGALTVAYLTTYGYCDMGGVASETATAEPGRVFYAPEIVGNRYVPVPGPA